PAYRNCDVPRPHLGRDPVLDRVLDQRLDGERGNTDLFAARLDLPVHAQTRTQSKLLHLQVALDLGDLVTETERRCPAGLQNVTHELAQPDRRRFGFGRRLGAECGDGGERVEQEVRMDPRTKSIEL